MKTVGCGRLDCAAESGLSSVSGGSAAVALLLLLGLALLLLVFRSSAGGWRASGGGELRHRLPASGRAEVVLTLTTTPERLAHSWTERALGNLLDVEGVHAVYLNVPHVFAKTGEAYSIPRFVSSLEASTHLRVHRCEDEGPATKLLATLRNPEVSDEAFVVVVDDGDQRRDYQTSRLRRYLQRPRRYH